VRVQRPWSEIREITERRRAAAQVLLRTLLKKSPKACAAPTPSSNAKRASC
jgi:hypothetical protein